ncbi:MAG: histidine kinase [Ornithinimicrobium sp.]
MFRHLPATTWRGEAWRLTLAALVSGLVILLAAQDPESLPVLAWGLDALLGLLCAAALLFRRRFPVTVTVALTLCSAVSLLSTGPALLALVSLGTRRRWRDDVVVFPAWLASGVAFAVLFDSPASPDIIGALITQALAFAACMGVGAAIGAQRSTVMALRARAESAESEQASRIARAQASERTRIAREMHDVLAHRISLIAMHSGALAYRSDLPREQIQQTAELLRDNADKAVSELREVLGVLRQEGEAEQSRAPQPDLTGLDQLVSEGSELSSPVTLDVRLHVPYGLGDVPRTTSRTAYRVVQEALTNARKHAPGMPVTVTLEGGPGQGLTFAIRNPPIQYGEVLRPPESSGMGLVGLTERVNLSGGVMAYGVDRSGDFAVHGRLAWDEEQR